MKKWAWAVVLMAGCAETKQPQPVEEPKPECCEPSKCKCEGCAGACDTTPCKCHPDTYCSNCGMNCKGK